MLFKVRISKFKVLGRIILTAGDAEETAEAGGAADIEDTGNL